MAKKKAKSKAAKEVVSIEAAMEELDDIVHTLESGQSSLTDSLTSFERGMKLLRDCHQQLDVAAQRIEILTGIDAEGRATTTDFDGSATVDQAPDNADDDDESATLF